jgi:hypothetical protein
MEDGEWREIGTHQPEELRLSRRERGDHGDGGEHKLEWLHHGDGNHTPPEVREGGG